MDFLILKYGLGLAVLVALIGAVIYIIYDQRKIKKQIKEAIKIQNERPKEIKGRRDPKETRIDKGADGTAPGSKPDKRITKQRNVPPKPVGSTSKEKQYFH